MIKFNKTKKAIFLSLLCLFFSGLPVLAGESITVTRSDGEKIPLRVYSPDTKECPPVAIFSPGAGGTERGYRYIGEGLSRQGWLTLVVGHKESGPGTLRNEVFASGLHEGLYKMVTNPDLQRSRLMDIDGALKWVEADCKHPYKVLLGHSMGTDIVMFEAGAANKLGVAGGRDRFDAYVALSASGPGSIFADDSWKSIRKPMLILTGTKDKGLEGTWKWRTRPFEVLPPGCKWLGVINGASHMNFAGIGMSGKTERLSLQTISLFLNGAKNGDCRIPPPIPGIEISEK
jgi:dienelactone hydrolase